MKNTEQTEHYHLLKRIDIGRTKPYPVFRCVSPECPKKKTSYLLPEFVIDTIVICWKCENPVVMTKKMSRMVKPKCVGCQMSKKTKSVLDDLAEMIKGMEK